MTSNQTGALSRSEQPADTRCERLRRLVEVQEERCGDPFGAYVNTYTIRELMGWLERP